jgi:hypothetical protein
MKKVIITTFIALSIFSLTSCNQDDKIMAPGQTDTPPANAIN